jgi:thymidylate kinase
MDAYLAIAKREPQRIVKVDARDPIPEVHRRIVRSVEERLIKIST